jgi:hypothetical protein
MDLLLVSEGDKAHVQEPKVRRLWHLLFASMVLFFLISFLLKNALRSTFPESLFVATSYRVFIFIFFVYLIVLLFSLATRFYTCLLKTSKDLRLSNILFFYFFGIILFAYLYQTLYLLKPSLFNMPNPLFIPEPYLMDKFSMSYLSLLDFMVYSATTIVTLSYYRIQSGSILVSFINIIEIFYGIAIVALLVATFIQKSDLKEKE